MTTDEPPTPKRPPLVDMSPAAVDRRLRQVEALRALVQALPRIPRAPQEPRR